MDSPLSNRDGTNLITICTVERVQRRDGGVRILPCESAKIGMPTRTSRLAHERLVEVASFRYKRAGEE
eukprot:16336124-Heterocapsa_arctica.AAC.1